MLELLGLLICLVFLLVGPIWTRWHYTSFGKLDLESLSRAIFARTAMLTAHLCVLFVAIYLSVIFVSRWVGPVYIGISPKDLHPDAILTVGSFLYLVLLIGFPYLVFRHAGLVGIRDYQQIGKELRDRKRKL